MRILLLGNDTETKRKCYGALSQEYSLNVEPMWDEDLCVLVNYPHIVDKEFIAQFPKGVINLHCSKLPAYRGRHPVVWQMINGEKEIGVTVHYVDEGIDTGDIILQTAFPLDINDTYSQVIDKFHQIGIPLLVEAVKLIELGAAPRIKQGEGTYYARRTPEDSAISPYLSAEARVRFINALTDPMPNAFDETLNGNRIYYKGARYEKRD